MVKHQGDVMIKGFINNDWDRDNLEFLLNTKGDDFHDFWKQSDEEDRIYARELLDAYSRELQFKSQELEIESLLEVGGMNSAKQVLKKFAL
jgi:hypothetical protein